MNRPPFLRFHRFLGMRFNAPTFKLAWVHLIFIFLVVELGGGSPYWAIFTVFFFYRSRDLQLRAEMHVIKKLGEEKFKKLMCEEMYRRDGIPL